MNNDESKRGTITQIDFDETPGHEKYWVKVKLLKGGSCWIQVRNTLVKKQIKSFAIGDEINVTYKESASISGSGVRFSNNYALDIQPLY
tara:strand:+ start:620 stop:886 length:267 start_codon:yes stop_codon:yes gene_type:complete